MTGNNGEEFEKVRTEVRTRLVIKDMRNWFVVCVVALQKEFPLQLSRKRGLEKIRWEPQTSCNQAITLLDEMPELLSRYDFRTSALDWRTSEKGSEKFG